MAKSTKPGKAVLDLHKKIQQVAETLQLLGLSRSTDAVDTATSYAYNGTGDFFEFKWCGKRYTIRPLKDNIEFRYLNNIRGTVLPERSIEEIMEYLETEKKSLDNAKKFLEE